MSVDLLRLVGHRKAAGPTTLATALNALTVLAGVGLMGTSAWLLATAALHPSIAWLQVAIVGVRFFGIARALLRYLERIVSHNAALLLTALLRLRVFRSLVPLVPARLPAVRSGDVLARLVDDVASLEGFFVRVAGPTLAAGLVLAAVAGLLAALHPALAAVALVGTGLTSAGALGLAWWRARRPVVRAAQMRGALGATLVDSLQGVAEILAFGLERTQLAGVTRLDATLVRDQASIARAASLGSALATLGADLTVVAILTLSIPAARGGTLPGVQIAVVVLLTLAAFEAVSALPAAGQNAAAGGAAAARLFEILDTPSPVMEPAPPTRLETGAASTVGIGSPVVEARHLSFTYPDEPLPVLRDVSLRIDAGRRIAIVGPSGSGKTTILQLLLRFWDAPAETLFLEGRDLREWPSDAARSRIAYADQHAHLLTGTLRENLMLAHPSASAEALDGVVEAMGLAGLVSRMGRGLDTWVGEQGHNLSGGERRRLALARALLRPAPLLLLDEPTAHLDSETERQVMAALVEAGRGRATLVVTHRLAGLQAFDEILVLEAGQVVERGRAAELAGGAGTFARMLSAQRSQSALDDAAFSAARAE